MRYWPGLLWVLISLFPALRLTATGDSTRYILPTDSVFIELDGFGSKYVIHNMEKRQTLFSLAKFYSLSLEELYWYNPELKERSYALGDPVRIPIPNKVIRRTMDKGVKTSEYAQLFYRVKRGDTMYGIAKRAFKMEVEELRTRNQIDEKGIKTGQVLKVGWIKINGVTPEMRQVSNHPLIQKNEAYEQRFIAQCRQDKVFSINGAADWNKGRQESDFFGLFDGVAPGHYVKVTDPLLKRSLFVKVIDSIPREAHTGSVVIVLSSQAAQLLGAVDARFFVEVEYCR